MWQGVKKYIDLRETLRISTAKQHALASLGRQLNIIRIHVLLHTTSPSLGPLACPVFPGALKIELTRQKAAPQPSLNLLKTLV